MIFFFFFFFIKIQNFSFTKIHLNMSSAMWLSAKWRSFCPGADDLIGLEVHRHYNVFCLQADVPYTAVQFGRTGSPTSLQRLLFAGGCSLHCSSVWPDWKPNVTTTSSVCRRMFPTLQFSLARLEAQRHYNVFCLQADVPYTAVQFDQTGSPTSLQRLLFAGGCSLHCSSVWPDWKPNVTTTSFVCRRMFPTPQFSLARLEAQRHYNVFCLQADVPYTAVQFGRTGSPTSLQRLRGHDPGRPTSLEVPEWQVDYMRPG